MIRITPQMRILLAVEPVDFRKGIDGLAMLCKSILKADPFAGYLFVFLNRRKTSIKVLSYDGQGFWMCQKRLSTRCQQICILKAIMQGMELGSG